MNNFEVKQPRTSPPESAERPAYRDSHPAPPPERRFRPALFAGYGDLSSLRHDYPLVLSWAEGEAGVHPLSERINEVLRAIAPPGAAGERLRCHVLRLENEIRALASRGKKVSLSDAWDHAESTLLADPGAADPKAMEEDLARAKAVMTLNGTLLDCQAGAPAAVVTHLWRAVETRKARALLQKIDRLVHRLQNWLQTDALSSPQSWEGNRVRQSMGGAFAQAFDFDALGGTIATIACRSGLPPARKQRLADSLSLLKYHRDLYQKDPGFEDFLFEKCEEAVEAQKLRLDEIAALVKAMGVAELELANRYREAVHDQAFRNFNRHSLKPEQISQFPSALVLLRDFSHTEGVAGILEAVASGHSIKVVLLCDDLLEETQIPTSLASMVTGLSNVLVLQATTSQLGRLSGMMAHGLTSESPAFFLIYTGADAHGLAPYLMAAAATESRLFPAFSYDPSGENWAEQFDLAANPHPARRWVEHPFSYEDSAHQRISGTVAFTPIDFAGCDTRYDEHFSAVPPDGWKDAMIPAAEFLELPLNDRVGRIPYIPAIDEQNRLWRRVPDEKLIRFAERCARKWRQLQELGGIDNSHTLRLIAQERSLWNEEKETELRQLREEMAAAAPAPASIAPASSSAPSDKNDVAPETAPEAEAPRTGEAWIETPRCTSCEECIKINDRMFVYNENKQAYIADPDAGPYVDLVKAAEACQISIIHPGNPRNPDEPGLEALRKRAEPFF